METQYLVTWEIDVWADDPQEAACKAQEMLSYPTAWVFGVAEADNREKVTHVDMEDVWDGPTYGGMAKADVEALRAENFRLKDALTEAEERRRYWEARCKNLET